MENLGAFHAFSSSAISTLNQSTCWRSSYKFITEFTTVPPTSPPSMKKEGKISRTHHPFTDDLSPLFFSCWAHIDPISTIHLFLLPRSCGRKYRWRQTLDGQVLFRLSSVGQIDYHRFKSGNFIDWRTLLKCASSLNKVFKWTRGSITMFPEAHLQNIPRKQ